MCAVRAVIVDKISIHALREEGDTLSLGDWLKPIRFLSTPSARRATPSATSDAVKKLFLSTPSARRATQEELAKKTDYHNFYPRPP